MSSYEIKLVKYVVNINRRSQINLKGSIAKHSEALVATYLYKHINKPSLFLLTMSLAGTITVKSHLMTSVFIKVS